MNCTARSSAGGAGECSSPATSPAYFLLTSHSAYHIPTRPCH